MNKIIKKLVFSCALIIGALSFHACTVSHYFVLTNNAVGDKQVTLDYSNIDRIQGFTYSQALSDGKMNKIGVVEYKKITYLFFTKEKMVVRGN